MTQFSKPVLLISLLVMMFIMTACGGDDSASGIVVGGGADSPQEAVELFLRAVYDGELERAISFVCTAQREPMRLLYADMTAAYEALQEVTVDLSGLTYTVTAEEEETATIAIIGDVKVTVGGEDRFINVDERFSAVALKKEDELWRVC
ncbi:MAG TPA: DUF4878 domain-containing protein [Aggregatilineales bacterium]|nr:DUF4878 domain-containing protein [Aggregatilineales bacterium]